MACCWNSPYFTLLVLFIINLLNYADRFTLSAVLIPLESHVQDGFGYKNDLTQLQVSFLQTAFIISYMLLSPIFGYLGDRFIRKYIIGIGILFWALFTLTGSFSVNYAMLLVMRCLVGVGEASYSTVAPTMIADLFPVEKRLRMLSIFYLAIPFGSGLGYGIGAGMKSIAEKVIPPNYTHPLNEPWRYAFRFTPLLGILMAVVVLLCVKEPKRGKADGHIGKGGAAVKGQHGFKAYIKDLKYCITNPSFMLSTIGFVAVTYSTGAWAFWAPTYIVKVSSGLPPSHGLCSHKFTELEASLIFGSISVVAGILGTLTGSELSKLIGRKTKTAECIVCAISLLGAVPFIYLGLVLSQYSNCMVGVIPILFLAVFMLCLNWAPVSAIVLYVTLPEKRSTASSVNILLSHILGDAMSPFIVGWIAVSVAGSEAYGLTTGLYTTAFVCVLGGGAFLMATLTVVKDRRLVEKTKSNRKLQDSDNDCSDDDSSNNEELLHGTVHT